MPAVHEVLGGGIFLFFFRDVKYTEAYLLSGISCYPANRSIARQAQLRQSHSLADYWNHPSLPQTNIHITTLCTLGAESALTSSCVDPITRVPTRRGGQREPSVSINQPCTYAPVDGKL